MVQYRVKAGKATDFRVYAQYFNQKHMLDPNGQNGGDGWHRLREGFRTDSRLSPKDSVMIEGDLSTGQEGEFGFELPSVTSPGFVAVSEQINLVKGRLNLFGTILTLKTRNPVCSFLLTTTAVEIR